MPKPQSEARRAVESLFRQQGTRLVATLARLFGIERLELAEDVVQEALARALQVWPSSGVPANPAAWVTQTAKNQVLDLVRREKRFRDKQRDIMTAVERWSTTSEDLDEEIRDDRLRLMFACCHPDLPLESQTALALRSLCGFTPAEVASALLTTEAGVVKRLTRARQRLREVGVTLEVPAGDRLAPRLEGVYRAIYLLFNEGYKASRGDQLIRAELCREAIRLATLVSETPVGRGPRCQALLALMWLSAARLPARVDSEGQLMRLQDQPRDLWDSGMIARGLAHLEQSAAGQEVSSFHLQAAIAAQHCCAPSYEETNWPAILQLYDGLLGLEPTPIVALNRAVALANVEGPAAALESLRTVMDAPELLGYYLFHAVRGDLESRLGHEGKAAEHLRRALELTELESERELLRSRLQALESTPAGGRVEDQATGRQALEASSIRGVSSPGS